LEVTSILNVVVAVPGWISVREAAGMLGVSKQRVHALMANGTLRAERHPLRIEQASVEAYARERQAGHCPQRASMAGPEGWMLSAEAARLLGCSVSGSISSSLTGSCVPAR
jgi:excisionase family DNA binding protein